MEPPIPVTAGQAGCFLPAGEIGYPGVFVLFGGISQSMTECGSDVCLINPDRGEWMSLMAPPRGTHDSVVSWPPGRCGHSVCALDSTRMLVLFGNLQPPTTQSSGGSPPPRRQRQGLPNGMDEEQADPPYHGQPAGDIWILTRIRVEHQSTRK